MSERLGMNRWTIPLITMAVGIPIAVYVIKQHCDQRTVGLLALGFLAAFCGAGLWDTVVGPWLF